MTSDRGHESVHRQNCAKNMHYGVVAVVLMSTVLVSNAADYWGRWDLRGSLRAAFSRRGADQVAAQQPVQQQYYPPTQESRVASPVPAGVGALVPSVRREYRAPWYSVPHAYGAYGTYAQNQGNSAPFLYALLPSAARGSGAHNGSYVPRQPSPVQQERVGYQVPERQEYTPTTGWTGAYDGRYQGQSSAVPEAASASVPSGARYHQLCAYTAVACAPSRAPTPSSYDTGVPTHQAGGEYSYAAPARMLHGGQQYGAPAYPSVSAAAAQPYGSRAPTPSVYDGAGQGDYRTAPTLGSVMPGNYVERAKECGVQTGAELLPDVTGLTQQVQELRNELNAWQEKYKRQGRRLRDIQSRMLQVIEDACAAKTGTEHGPITWQQGGRSLLA